MIEKTSGKVSRSGFRRMPDKKQASNGSQFLIQNYEQTVEILVDGQECPFCHFAKLKRDGDEIVCPICGYGRKPCT